MRKRCRYAKHPKYHLYGGRGISICERWDSFENFYADMGACPFTRGSIDRIDPDKGYCPENCRWLPLSQQSANRRITVRVGGVCLAEAARTHGIKESTLRQRIAAGWPQEKLFKTPKELNTRK